MKKPHDNHYVYEILVLFGAFALAICLFFVFYYLDGILSWIGNLIRILMPFIYGAVIAYILRPVCAFFEKYFGKWLSGGGKKMSGIGMRLVKPLAVFCSLALGFLVIMVLLALVVPQVVQSLSGLIGQIQRALVNLENWADTNLGEDNVISNYIESFTEGLSETISTWITQTLLPNLESLVSGVTARVMGIVTLIYNLVIGLIISIYLLLGRKKFCRQGKMLLYSAFSKPHADALLDEIRFADRMFTGFISGRLVDSVIIGIICFVFTSLAQIPYALLVSVIVGVTNIIPFFGPFLGAIPSALLILLKDPVKCVIFLIFILILQQFDGNILSPRILGNVTGLPSFWVLFAIIVFGGLFGFVGMIIGVPVFAVIYDILKKLVYAGLRRHHADESMGEEKPS